MVVDHSTIMNIYGTDRNFEVQSDLPGCPRKSSEDGSTGSCDPVWRARGRGRSTTSFEASAQLGRLAGRYRTDSWGYCVSSERGRRLGSSALMRLLLDTHIWLWSALERGRLSRRVITALQDPDNVLWLSPISLWEVLTLCQKKKLTLSPDPQTWIEDTLNAIPVREAPITYQVAQETGRVQLPHRDPADRFLMATARIFDLTLVTADEALIRSQQASVLANS